MSTEDEPDETRERSSTSIIVALIGAGAIIVAAVIGLLANRSTTGPPSAMPQVPGSPTSQTSETLPSSSPPSPTSFVPIVQILEPTKDKSVGYEAGTEVKGTAFNLGSKSLWLFQLSESPRKGLAYHIASDLMPVVNGEWSTQVN